MRQIIKLLGNIRNKTNEDKNGEYVPHLGNTKVVLIHCNILNNSCQKHSRVLVSF